MHANKVVEQTASTNLPPGILQIAVPDSVKLPGYEILRELARGGMSTVYLARQLPHDRLVALKIMAADWLEQPELCERFLSEGEMVARLEHEHIIHVFDIGNHFSDYYISMEFASGGTLDQRIQEGIALPQSVEILRCVANALGYAHENRIIHRDIKPANVLFREDDTPILSDFGIAKVIDTTSEFTKLNLQAWTPAYASPETLQGQPSDFRSDLYSLGVMFYEMLTQKKPYKSEDAFAEAYMHVNQPVPRLPSPCARAQPIIDRLMAKDPGERFSSAYALIVGIDNIFADKAPTKLLPRARNTRAESANLQRSGEFDDTGGTKKRTWVPYAAVVGALLILVVTSLFILDTAPPPVPTNKGEIADLLEAARVRVEMGQTTEPCGLSAYDTYKLVVRLDKNNMEAIEFLSSHTSSCPE